MEIKKIMQEIHKNAVEKGFWEDKATKNVGEVLMLVVSELAEALEADRKGKRVKTSDVAWMEASQDESHLYEEHFQDTIKDTFEDEIADAVIRLFDLSEGFGIDLEFHIKHKLEFNKRRPYKHNKEY